MSQATEFERWLATGDATQVKLALLECPHDQRRAMQMAMAVVFAAGSESGARDMGKVMIRAMYRREAVS